MHAIAFPTITFTNISNATRTVNPKTCMYNPFLVYCRELAPSTVSLTGDRAQGDDSKHDSHYKPVDMQVEFTK